MEALLSSAIRAAKSLFTYGMIEVFMKTIVVTVMSLAIFVVFFSLFFDWLAHEVHGLAIANFLPWLGSIGASLIAWILFPAIMPVIINFFDDTIAFLIEEQDYPKSMKGHEQAFWPKFWHDMRFSLVAIGLNVLVLPLYLVPVLNMCLFYFLNGYLLGREFFCMVARRHVSSRETDNMYHNHSAVIICTGVLVCVLATIPVANLPAPFWGIAMMVHLYHRLEPLLELELVTPKSPLHR